MQFKTIAAAATVAVSVASAAPVTSSLSSPQPSMVPTTQIPTTKDGVKWANTTSPSKFVDAVVKSLGLNITEVNKTTKAADKPLPKNKFDLPIDVDNLRKPCHNSIWCEMHKGDPNIFVNDNFEPVEKRSNISDEVIKSDNMTIASEKMAMEALNIFVARFMMEEIIGNTIFASQNLNKTMDLLKNLTWTQTVGVNANEINKTTPSDMMVKEVEKTVVTIKVAQLFIDFLETINAVKIAGAAAKWNTTSPAKAMTKDFMQKLDLAIETETRQIIEEDHPTKSPAMVMVMESIQGLAMRLRNSPLPDTTIINNTTLTARQLLPPIWIPAFPEPGKLNASNGTNITWISESWKPKGHDRKIAEAIKDAAEDDE